ncbi:MAG: hypothetical protein ACRBN8_42605 [Nannocystales bacterium]
MPALLLRAIVTGFGYKIGAELGRFVAEKVGLAKKPDEKKEAEEDSGYPTGMTDGPDPDEPDAEPDGDATPEQGAGDLANAGSESAA